MPGETPSEHMAAVGQMVWPSKTTLLFVGTFKMFGKEGSKSNYHDQALEM